MRIKIILITLLCIACQMTYSHPSAPTYRAQLATLTAEQLTPELLRITVRLNANLSPDATFNMAIFASNATNLSNCDQYPGYNACYFPGVNNSAPFTFLLNGYFIRGWKNAIGESLLVVFNIASPNDACVTYKISNIVFPYNASATIELYPVSGLASTV